MNRMILKKINQRMIKKIDRVFTLIQHLQRSALLVNSNTARKVNSGDISLDF